MFSKKVPLTDEYVSHFKAIGCISKATYSRLAKLPFRMIKKIKYLFFCLPYKVDIAFLRQIFVKLKEEVICPLTI